MFSGYDSVWDIVFALSRGLIVFFCFVQLPTKSLIFLIKTAFDVVMDPLFVWKNVRPPLPLQVRAASGKPSMLALDSLEETDGSGVLAPEEEEQEEQHAQTLPSTTGQENEEQYEETEQGPPAVELLQEPLVRPRTRKDSSVIMHAWGAAVRPLGTQWLPESLQGAHEVNTLEAALLKTPL